MRKLLGPGLLLCALIAGCETKSPSGPTGNTPTTSTTTSVAPTTSSPTTSTSTSTTTTIVLGSLSRRYSTFSPAPNVPADMTLFFELIPGLPSTAGSGFASGKGVFGITENEYKVTGVYVMGNGTTGTVTGELGGSLNPLETGGDFKGSMTASPPSGSCTSLRDFNGVLGPNSLAWTGGAVGATPNPCSPNLLTAFNSLSMLRNDPSAPLPTTTSSVSTTSTSTTTVACSYSLTPPSDTAPSSGGTQSVNVVTQAGCAWSAQSFAPFITINPPYGGAGSATVTYNVAPTTTARAGTLLIAGVQFVVSQSAPPPPPAPDLVPYSPLGTSQDAYCRTDQKGQLVVGVNNVGAAGATTSQTRVVFTTSTGPVTMNVSTPTVNPKVPVDVTVSFPTSPSFCYNPNCIFTITVNADGAVTEGPQPAASGNNTATGMCLG